MAVVAGIIPITTTGPASGIQTTSGLEGKWTVTKTIPGNSDGSWMGITIPIP